MTARQEVRMLTALLALVSVGLGFLDIVLGLVFSGMTILCAAFGYAVTKEDGP